MWNLLFMGIKENTQYNVVLEAVFYNRTILMGWEIIWFSEAVCPRRDSVEEPESYRRITASGKDLLARIEAEFSKETKKVPIWLRMS